MLGLTRKSKWVLGGICAFAVIATTTTGLASWVIGSSSSADGSGNITVAGIDNLDCSVTITSTSADLIVNFGPDSKGNEVVNASTDTSEEDLSFTIKGTLVTDSNSYTTVKVLLKSDGIASFITDGYIAVPDGFTAVTGENGGWETSINVTNKSFEKTYSFKWGSKFNNLNPCKYYDNTTGKTKTEAKTALEELNKLNGKTFSFTVTPLLADSSN